jgi:hypothetical protein
MSGARSAFAHHRTLSFVMRYGGASRAAHQVGEIAAPLKRESIDRIDGVLKSGPEQAEKPEKRGG